MNLDAEIEHVIQELEAQRGGWLHAIDCQNHQLPRIQVRVDGKIVGSVLAANRREGMVVIHDQPLALTAFGATFTSRAIQGVVTFHVMGTE